MDRLTVFRERYVENVERMFAAVSDLYANYWGEFFHFAIFERGDEGWSQAFAATHRRYMDALCIERAEKVLDLACGRGGFANLLAQNTAGEVLGIDLAPAQLGHCRRYKRANLRFQRQDIMQVDRLQQSFDAISFLDADCYLPDKLVAMERIGAILRPGGRLLLLSWCKAPGLTRLQEELVLVPFMRYWGIPGLETTARYKACFARIGLRLLEEADLNACTARNWNFAYEQALRGVQELSPRAAARLVWKGIRSGELGLSLLKDQFPAALYIKAAFDLGFLRYCYFLAEKPGRDA